MAVSTPKSEAISTAATDVTTKTNKALEDAKTYADIKVQELTDGQVTISLKEQHTLLSAKLK